MQQPDSHRNNRSITKGSGPSEQACALLTRQSYPLKPSTTADAPRTLFLADVFQNPVACIVARTEPSATVCEQKLLAPEEE
jgi:hypothetical protein